MSKVIDAKGLQCPMPVIMAKNQIDDGNTDFMVEVDNIIAVENLKKLANSQNMNCYVKENNDTFMVYFSKESKDNNEYEECEECNKILNLEEDKNKLTSWSIFIGRDIIGSGDEELGKSLMKMYLYTISEGSDLPKSILFMNNGVKVPTLNEQAIEHLKDLENKGVEILVCGACLDFYKLQQELKVGKISNMYEITNHMKEASKVITL